MPPAEPITSTANPRLKALVRLRERRERDRSGLFLIEGYRELRRTRPGRPECAAGDVSAGGPAGSDAKVRARWTP